MERLAGVNRHHIWYCRSTYDQRPHLRKLRRDPRFIVPINIPDHDALHATLRGVPLPDHEAIRFLFQEILTPYSRELPRQTWLDQAIGFFALSSLGTAEHLSEQRIWIVRTPLMEGVDDAA